jgi:hypothetical protein
LKWCTKGRGPQELQYLFWSLTLSALEAEIFTFLYQPSKQDY